MTRVSATTLFVLCLASPVAIAQVVGFGELQGAVKLSAQELRGIAEGAKASTISASNFSQQWENESGGKLTASSRNLSSNNPRLGYGSGTWRIEDDGRYCVEIAWARSSEKWCRHIFRSGGKLYLSAGSASPDGKAYEIEFRK
jgi:Protein of unknown function (DUF995)